MDTSEVALLISVFNAIAIAINAKTTRQSYARKPPALKVEQRLKRGVGDKADLEIEVTLINDGETPGQVRSLTLTLASCYQCSTLYMSPKTDRPTRYIIEHEETPVATQDIELEEVQGRPFAPLIEGFSGITRSIPVRECVKGVMVTLTNRPDSGHGHLYHTPLGVVLMARVAAILANGRIICTEWSKVPAELFGCSCRKCRGVGKQLNFDDLGE